MSRFRSGLFGVGVVLGFVLMTMLGRTSVGAQAATLLAGTLSGAPVMLTATSLGYLNIAVPGGITEGSTTVYRNVETVATTKVPSNAESGELYTNGADVDGQILTLPNDPTVGVWFSVVLTATDTSNSFAVGPGAGETLYLGSSVCTTLTATAKGASLTVVAAAGGAGGVWTALSSTGTWTCT